METINYEKLIDPLCIPCIRLLREKLNIETLYCCQGKIIGDKSHSETGYVMCKLNDKTEKILIETVKKVARIGDFSIRLYLGYNFYYNEKEAIVIRFNTVMTESQRRRNWTTLEKVLESFAI